MTRQKKDGPLMEAVWFGDFVERYGPEEGQEGDGPTIEETVALVQQLLADGPMPQTQFLAALDERRISDRTWGELKRRLRFFLTWKDGTQYWSLSRPADGAAYSCSPYPMTPTR